MLLYYTKVREGDDRSALVRQLLRRAWLDEYGGDMPKMAKDAHGKPFFPGRDDLFFSLSHTDTYVMCALGKMPVGVDIQTVRPVSGRLAQYVSDRDELAAFGFFPLWCLKESYIKLVGRRTGQMRGIRFSCRDGAIRGPEDGLTCALYEDIPGCCAAVCIRGDIAPEPRLIERESLAV